MEYLIKSAKIISPNSSLHLKTQDILINNGKIATIATTIESSNAKIIKHKNLHVSTGWVDLHTNLQDPGYEVKEDISSAISAAAAGGFTKIAISPLSSPIRDSKAQIEYVLNSSKGKAVTLLPYGAVSKGAQGKELAELYDMKQSGAVAFFDGKNSISNPNLLNRALLYTQAFEGLVINFPHTKELAYKGVMNEGVSSTNLGLKGIPEIAESTMVSRDLHLLTYTNGKLHFNCISTAESLELIKTAQKNNLNVTCDVASYSLLLSDDELNSFDSRFKTLPPLRDKNCIKKLIKAVKQGTIKAVCSDHLPEDIESKKKELDHAAFGIINLQTSFAAANTALKGEIELTKIIDLFTTGPSEILGLKKVKIEEGEKANLTLFSPDEEFTLTKEMVKSKSKNSPFFGRKLNGKVVGIVNNGKVVLN